MLLAGMGEQGLPAGEIARKLRVSVSALSSHLRVLAQSEMIEGRRDGRTIFYSFVPKAMSDLLAHLEFSSRAPTAPKK